MSGSQQLRRCSELLSSVVRHSVEPVNVLSSQYQLLLTSVIQGIVPSRASGPQVAHSAARDLPTVSVKSQQQSTSQQRSTGPPVTKSIMAFKITPSVVQHPQTNDVVMSKIIFSPNTFLQIISSLRVQRRHRRI